MKCLVCLNAETSSTTGGLCVDCTKSLKYAEDLVKRTGVGFKMTYNLAVGPVIIERDNLSKRYEKNHWVVEITPKPDLDGTLDQPVYTGVGEFLKDACEIAYGKLGEDLAKLGEALDKLGEDLKNVI